MALLMENQWRGFIPIVETNVPPTTIRSLKNSFSFVINELQYTHFIISHRIVGDHLVSFLCFFVIKVTFLNKIMITES